MTMEGAAIDDLALWLGAPAHVLLARQPPRRAEDGVLGGPEELMHLHGALGRAQEKPRLVSPRNVDDSQFRFGPHLHVHVPLHAEQTGWYTLFTTVRRAGANSSAQGLLVFCSSRIRYASDLGFYCDLGTWQSHARIVGL